MKPEICEVCRQRLDAVLWAVGRHPGCGTRQAIPGETFDRLVAYVAHALGGRPIEGRQL